MITDYSNPYVRQHVLSHIMKFTDKENPVEFILQIPEVRKAGSVYHGLIDYIRNDKFCKTVNDKRAFLYDTLQFMAGDMELLDGQVNDWYEQIIADEASTIVSEYRSFMNAKNRYDFMLNKAREILDTDKENKIAKAIFAAFST